MQKSARRYQVVLCRHRLPPDHRVVADSTWCDCADFGVLLKPRSSTIDDQRWVIAVAVTVPLAVATVIDIVGWVQKKGVLPTQPEW